MNCLRPLESWVRIPLEAWMSVYVYHVFALSCVQVAALRRANSLSNESYRHCVGLRNWKSHQSLQRTVEHNRSLKVTVQGLDFMAHSLYILYDWRFTACQFVLATSPLRLTTSFFFQLNTCFHNLYVTSSLTRRWVHKLQLLLVLVGAVILKFDSLGTRYYILLSQIQDSPNLEGETPCLYPSGTGWLS
jgi:hypothetical protein